MHGHATRSTALRCAISTRDSAERARAASRHRSRQYACVVRSLRRRRFVPLRVVFARRCGVALSLIAFVAVLAACGGSSDTEQGSPTSTRPTVTVADSTVAPSTTAAAVGPTECERTLFPVYAAHRVYAMPQPNDEADPLIPLPPGVERLRYAPPGDTDREGNTVIPVGATVELHRADGTVTFARPGDLIGLVSSLPDFGDLDGDGHVDHVVATESGWYAIREPLAPGVYDPGKVGIFLRLSNALLPPGLFAGPVGDQNGDGAEDIAIGDKLYSGREVVSHTAGATTTLPRPFTTVAHLASALALDPNRPPTLVQDLNGTPLSKTPNNAVQLRVGSDCLATADATSIPTREMAGRMIEGYLVDGHRVIELSTDTRNSFIVDRWDLDA